MKMPKGTAWYKRMAAREGDLEIGAGGSGRRQLVMQRDAPLRTAYTEGMGWRVMQGSVPVASGFDTREEAQARLAELVWDI